MKNLKRSVIAMILGALHAYGADAIDEQIQAVLRASPADRVKLMNQLKLQLASMSEQQRITAIQTLQTKMNGAVCVPIYRIEQQNIDMRSVQIRQTQFMHQNEIMKQQATMPYGSMLNSGKKQ